MSSPAAGPGLPARPGAGDGVPTPGETGGPGADPRDLQWLAGYPHRRRVLAARRRRVEGALFAEQERAATWRRVRLASWGLVLAGAALVAAGLPARADLGFLAGSVVFLLGGLGLAADRLGEAERAARRDRLAARLATLVRRGNEMDERARRIAARTGSDPWTAAFRLPADPAAGDRSRVRVPGGTR